MLKGFKDFIMRGNVVDLAVGIVIGAAFTGVVTAFTSGFIKPLIQLLGGDTSANADVLRDTLRFASVARGEIQPRTVVGKFERECARDRAGGAENQNLLHRGKV